MQQGVEVTQWRSEMCKMAICETRTNGVQGKTCVRGLFWYVAYARGMQPCEFRLHLNPTANTDTRDTE